MCFCHTQEHIKWFVLHILDKTQLKFQIMVDKQSDKKDEDKDVKHLQYIHLIIAIHETNHWQ